MSTNVTRRGAMLASALTLGGTAVSAAHPGYETDHMTQGLVVRLMWVYNRWCVAQPDHEYVEKAIERGAFVPGMSIPYRNISLDSFLVQAEKDFKLPDTRGKVKFAGPPCCPEAQFYTCNDSEVRCDHCDRAYRADRS